MDGKLNIILHLISVDGVILKVYCKISW